MDDESNRPPPKIRSAFVDILLASLYGDAAATAIGLVVAIAGGGVEYGWGLFAFLPIVSGVIAGIYLRQRSRDASHVLLASLISIVIPAFALLYLQTEGVACIFMASPLAFCTHFLAALIGGTAAGSRGRPLQISFLVLAPFIYASESVLPSAPSYHAVTTTIIVKATPDRIWPYLVNLDNIQPTNNLLFKAGIGHPYSTHTNGGGVGAARFCELSTGEMPERISVWQPGRLLVFDMLATPACMKELNPFGPVHAAHLTGYFTCHQGRFELRPLGPNRTEIIGTSTYDHRFGPTWYWSLWTNYIVHSVHSSVLEEIKRRAETSEQSRGAQ